MAKARVHNISADWLQTNRQHMLAFRHDLHQHPELGFEETRTAQKVAAALRSYGLDVYTDIGQTGVVGVLKHGTGSRTVLLRADMDALPITEQSSHGYVSKTTGNMHACGHDGHTTMLLFAAKYLAETLPFSGTILFLFQPNEEHGLGAKAMLADGLLETFTPDEAYAIHNLPGAVLGEVSTRVGMICTSESLFEIEIKGQGGHASMPHVGIDTITVGAELVLALQTIVSRKMAPGSGAVVSVTEFITDGQRNVLPGHTLIKGDARARKPQDRVIIERLMRQIASGVAQTHNVAIKMTFNTEFVETYNAAAQVAAVVSAATKLGVPVVPDRTPMSFSEDFGIFAEAIPGCFLLLGNGTAGVYSQPLHSNDYDFNDAVLPIGVQFWTQLVIERLSANID